MDSVVWKKRSRNIFDIQCRVPVRRYVSRPELGDKAELPIIIILIGLLAHFEGTNAYCLSIKLHLPGCLLWCSFLSSKSGCVQNNPQGWCKPRCLKTSNFGTDTFPSLLIGLIMDFLHSNLHDIFSCISCGVRVTVSQPFLAQ